MTCDCGKGRPEPTCTRPGHSAASLGLSTQTTTECNCGVEQDDEIHDFGCSLYPEHAPRWPS